MVHVGAVFFEFGFVSFLLGLLLLISGVKSRGKDDTERKKFSVWFFVMVLGIVLIVAGMIIPI
jgi:heme/copper-type cytochrome/quinol oxidase subunit 2